MAPWERTTGDVPVTKYRETFISPFSVTAPGDALQTNTKTKKRHWWQWRRRTIQVSGSTPTFSREALEFVLIRGFDRQQTIDATEPQSPAMTELPLTPRELLPPIEKDTLRPFELELGKLVSNHPWPGYNRLYTDDAEVVR